jgi:hypothetical protein
MPRTLSFAQLLLACAGCAACHRGAGAPDDGSNGRNDGSNGHHDSSQPPLDSATPLPSGPTGSWRLAWRDEFDGTALDASHWNVGWLTAPAAAGQGNTAAVTDSQQSGTYFGPAAFSFPGDGALHVRLSHPIDPGAPAGFSVRESGLITTAGLWSFNPSSVAYAGAGQTIDGTQVIEIRARLAGPVASAQGYWPAFWMTNAGNYNGGGQAYQEEVDLLEGLDGNGARGANLKFHLHKASEFGNSTEVLVVPPALAAADVSLGYHVWTFYLSTTEIRAWFDGTQLAIDPSQSLVSPQWTTPQYLMLAFQAEAPAIVPTSATGSPNDLMLDYVRVFVRP